MFQDHNYISLKLVFCLVWYVDLENYALCFSVADSNAPFGGVVDALMTLQINCILLSSCFVRRIQNQRIVLRVSMKSVNSYHVSQIIDFSI